MNYGPARLPFHGSASSVGQRARPLASRRASRTPEPDTGTGRGEEVS